MGPNRVLGYIILIIRNPQHGIGSYLSLYNIGIIAELIQYYKGYQRLYTIGETVGSQRL